jgi:drug/metabolite transporter (DMT)-like permease
MTAAALALVLGAALLHAGWNALAKRGADPIAFLWWIGTLGVILYAPVALATLRAHPLSAAGLPFLAGTVILHAAYFFTLGRAYHVGDLSVVYPAARGLSVALVPIFGRVLLDERLSPLGALGVTLVVAGILALHWRPGAWRAAASEPGTGWAAATGLLIASYSLLDKGGVARVHPVVYIWLMEIGAGLLLVPVVLTRRGALAREWRRSRPALFLGALMSPTGYLLVLFALQLSKAAYVVAARELSIVLSALIGTLWLREGRAAPRLAGAAVILAGVACVALAR